ncbi:TPA: DUF2158 domain-containing protein [Yersinia enterocolitica]|nr:DUF2158 domain-containing protein [Yersinia enterocolitica]
MSTEYQTGQIVKLKSGGPEMTVNGYVQSQRGFKCQWFAGKKLEFGHFPAESLELVVKSPEA